MSLLIENKKKVTEDLMKLDIHLFLIACAVQFLMIYEMTNTK